jgi:hypothetical protein
MELTYACRKCDAVDRAPAIETTAVLTCHSCGAERPVDPHAFNGTGLAACPCCGTDDLYKQKDFPQGLGLAIVIAGFVVSSVFWYYERPIWTYAILLTSALMDMFLYYRVPDVTICYRCLAQVRGAGANPGGIYHHFDLAVGERYRQERIRVDEHRRREGEAVSPQDGNPTL